MEVCIASDILGSHFISPWNRQCLLLDTLCKFNREACYRYLCIQKNWFESRYLCSHFIQVFCMWIQKIGCTSHAVWKTIWKVWWHQL